MKTLLTFLILIPLCASLNRLRGRHAWAAHLYGGVLAVLLILTGGWWFALAYPLFIFGECFGWGTILGMVLDGKDETEEQAQMLLSVRGAWWWGGICLLFAWNGTPLPMVLSALFVLSVGFPLCVQAAGKFKVKDRWALSEWFYGALQGLMIGWLTTGGV